jgi:hypothetical protein
MPNSPRRLRYSGGRERDVYSAIGYAVKHASTGFRSATRRALRLFEGAYRGERNQNRCWIAPVYGQAMIAFQRMKTGIPQRLSAAGLVGVVRHPPAGSEAVSTVCDSARTDTLTIL